ncbi:MAG TPA: pilus assembly protein PilM [Spirochaetota bacterium]|nr:pilus assembly protein PilM [Spirochaetota bacterium]HPU89790.1 pilus assembly protein PilM [Spirochaetota bacterium]
MFEKIAALDIGTSSIKIILVRTGFKDFQVVSFVYEDIDLNVEDHKAAVRDALGRIIRENPLDGYTLVTTLPMESAIIRNLVFPFTDYAKIAQAIPFEAEEIIPFKMEHLITHFQKLRGKTPDESRVLLAASHKDIINDRLKLLEEFGLAPVRMGLESNSMYECYRYFNKMPEEAIIQVDIGHSKTVMNIIKDSELLFTRCIPVGIGGVYDTICEKLEISRNDAVDLLANLNIDLTAFENNLQRDYYKTLKVTKSTLREIFDNLTGSVQEIVEQIVLTNKSFAVDYMPLEFNRILLSGGGSTIQGIGTILSNELGLPVVSLPFLVEYHNDVRVQTQFPVAFGTVISHLNKKSLPVNFLRDEFQPAYGADSHRMYYLAGMFLILSIVVLFVNVVVSSILKTTVNNKYNTILQERFQRYFRMQNPGNDPVATAMKLYQDEKKEFSSLKSVVQAEDSTLEVLKAILTHFPKDPTFELSNIVINERIVRIDGTIASSKNIDDFKNKLSESPRFESVNLNTNIDKKNQVRFSLTIKLRIADDQQREYKKIR